MKVLISIDMEGIAGLSNWKENEKRITKFMTDEVDAVVAGIKDYDAAAKILVCDSHSIGQNVEIFDLPEDVELIRGYPRPYYMVSGFEEGFDAAIFLGYHAPVGIENAEMDHTYSSGSIFETTVNGKKVGEAELNALVLGEIDIPVALIAGDDKLEAFSKNFFPNTNFVITKRALGRFSAKLIHPKKVGRMLRENTKIALENLDKIKPLKIKKPYEIRITFLYTVMAEFASLIPASKRIDGRTVSFKHSDFREIYRFLMGAVTLAGVARNL